MTEFNNAVREYMETTDYEVGFNTVKDLLIIDLELYLNIVKKSQNIERLCINLKNLSDVCLDASDRLTKELLED